MSEPSVAVMETTMAKANAVPTRVTPRPNNTEPIPQPAPKRAVRANSVPDTPAKTAAGRGMAKPTRSQGTITIPTTEYNNQLFSQAQPRTDFKGTVKLPPITPAAATSAKPVQTSFMDIAPAGLHVARDRKKSRNRIVSERLSHSLQCSQSIHTYSMPSHPV